MRYHAPAGQKGEANVKRFIMCCLPILALLVLLSAAPAFAATDTSTFQVTASVAANCTISSTNIAFGSYDPVVANASTPLDGTGTVTVRCNKGTSANIGLDLGSNAAGSTRRMASGAERLTYEIYSESGRTAIWTNSAPNWVAHTPTGPPNQATYTMYGRVPAGQEVATGSYSDTVTATVNY
jgi:spore coat protein U-like protein